MRVVFHIAKWYPNRLDNLAGIFVKRHIQSLPEDVRSGVLFCVVDPSISKSEYTLDDEDGILTFRGYYKRKYTGIGPLDKLLRIRAYFKMMKKGHKLLSDKLGPPQLHHVHILLRTGLFALRMKRKRSIPYIITEHWSIYSPSKSNEFSSLRKKYSAKVFRNASCVTTVSQELLSNLTDYHGFDVKKSIITRNVADEDRFTVRPSTNDKKILLHVSEFNERDKNVLGILSAINTLAEQRKDFEFHLIGYGQDQDRIEQKIESLNLKDIIFFHGKKTGAELADWFSRADLFIMFSYLENLPCVIAESHMSGTPVIASKVGGIPEMINERNGLLVESKAEDQLVDKMNRFLNGEYNFQSPKEMSEKAIKTYGYRSVGKIFLDAYTEIS